MNVSLVYIPSIVSPENRKRLRHLCQYAANVEMATISTRYLSSVPVHGYQLAFYRKIGSKTRADGVTHH